MRMRRFKLYILLAAFVILLIGAASLLLHPPISTTSLPWTFDCELQSPPKPESFLITCADGNEELWKISWKSWTLTSAEGAGFYVHNDCNPDCANGHFITEPISVRLSRPVFLKDRVYLVDLEWHGINASSTASAEGSSGKWNLYENFRMMGGKL
jgi:hypothetical protein